MIPTDGSNSYTTYVNQQIAAGNGSINGEPVTVFNTAPQHSTSNETELYTDVLPEDLPAANAFNGAKGVLTSDANGEIVGFFTIPNNSRHRFQTGTRTFKLIDNEYNNEKESDTRAQTKYTANGLRQDRQSSVASVRIPTVEPARTFRSETTRWTTTRTTAGSSLTVLSEWDPIAQTFTVREDYPNGLFLSDIDIFLASKPNDGNIPISVYIVPTENGIPTQTVVPGSEVSKLAKDIPDSFVTGRNIITDNGGSDNFGGNYGEVDPSQTLIYSKPTRFTFDYPVYLKPGEEYAVVIFSISPEYRVWTSVLSELDLNSNQIITRNPAFGVMLKSLNKSTWTPDQYRNLTCRLHKAIFETNQTFEAKFSTFLHDSGQYAFDTTTMTGNDQGISEYDHTGFKALMKAQEFPFTNFELEIAHRNPSGARNSVTPQGKYVINAGDEVQLDSEIPGVEINHITADARLTTFDRDTSPVIDLETGTIISYANLINDDLTGEGSEIDANGDYIPAEAPTDGGNALARYITKHVVLNNASEDLRVILAVNRPSEDCDIAVYAKRKSLDEAEKDITEVGWYRMSLYSVGGDTNAKSAPISLVPTDYSEMEYVLADPDPNVNDPIADSDGGLFTEFAIKVVFITSNKAKVCKIKNFTAIASI